MSHFTYIFLFVFIVVHCDASKLNVPRVLLPIFKNFSPTFTLEAIDGGCYKWSTTRDDIIKLTPINENPNLKCSAKMVVNISTKEEARNLAVVVAENVHTNQMLKCDVIVDVIHSLSITTTTRELFMEEVPEAFQINAYDSQGNEFSTLEGVEFDWQIAPIGPSRGVTILRFMKFKDSPYEIPPNLEKLESKNKKGFMVLLEGVKTGSVKITARLPYPEYKHVPVVDVVLNVVANLLLTPVEVYMMVGDMIKYKLYFMSSGKMQEIQLPDPQYYLETELKDCAIVNVKTSQVTALQIGRTKVTLHNKMIDENEQALKLPEANVNIVKPAYITIDILPYKNWNVLVGDVHEIAIEVHDSNDHKLHIGAGVRFSTEIGDIFHVENRTQNGSWIMGWGLREGIATVIARMEYILHPSMGQFELPKPLVSKVEMHIYPRIVITPSAVILPWDPQIKPKYDVDLVAKGGDGKFLWTSNDHSIGVVTQSGRVHTHTEGTFEVTASMLRNHNNKQTVKFSILPPSRLEIVEYVMEEEVGSKIYLHVAVFASLDKDDNVLQVPFTRCQDLPFQIKISDDKFKYDKSAVLSPVGISCGNIALTAQTVGVSKVTVSYYYEGQVMKDTVTVGAFKPLKLIHPEKEIVLAVGSSINLIYQGGPRSTIDRSSDYKKAIIIDDATRVKAKEIPFSDNPLTNEDTTVIQVVCMKLGETMVRLSITNKPSIPNCKERECQLPTRIICGKPRRISVKPIIQLGDLQACPMDLIGGRVVVQSNRDIKLDVVVEDEMGRRFLNVTSLKLKWSAKPDANVKFSSAESVIGANLTFGRIPLVGENSQVITATARTGLMEICAQIVSYRRDVLFSNRIVPESPEFCSDSSDNYDKNLLIASTTLYLVHETKVTPNTTTIFNHPANRRVLLVEHGSGYYELELSASTIANVNYMETSHEIEISPLKGGELIVRLNDLCLLSKPTLLYIKVRAVAKLRVEMADKIEIGKCINVIVRLYDEDDALMIIPDQDKVDLAFRFKDEIAVLRIDDVKKDRGEIHYILTGTQLGESKLTFSINDGSKEIFSTPMDLQVFPPLKVTPRNATILIGSTLQFTVNGGPIPDSNIEFNLDNDKIADIKSNGIITGRNVGKTRIIIQSVGVHPTTAKKIVYSEDSVDLSVGFLVGIKISSPLIRFKTGATVPVWISGIPEIFSPITIGSLQEPSMTFDWGLEENNVAILSDAFRPIGIVYKRTNQVAVRLTGLRPGKTRLSVNVTMPGSVVNKPRKESVKFTSWLDFEIFDALLLTYPNELPGESLLMAPYSSVMLKMNLGREHKIQYILSDSVSSGKELLIQKKDPNQIATISKNGELTTYGKTGKMSLVVATDVLGVKQTLHYTVEVKPIHYMMLNVEADWRVQSDNLLQEIPLGMEFQLKTDFYDEIGRLFYAGPSDISIRMSRCDLIKLAQSPDNASMWISTKQNGQMVLKVQAGDFDKVVDYVKLQLAQVIKPNIDHLTSGDIVCLWTPVVTKHLQKGTWSSSDDDLIEIHQLHDVAFVKGLREGTVDISHSLHPAASLRLSVKPTHSIVLLPNKKDDILTNAPIGSHYQMPVVLRSKQAISTKINNLIQGWHCTPKLLQIIEPKLFKCYHKFSNPNLTIQSDELFDVSSAFIADSGQYCCQLRSKGRNGTDISKLETNLTLWAIDETGQIHSNAYDVPFIPQVYFRNEVLLNENSNFGEMNVIGLQKILRKVKVTPVDSSIIYVDSGHFINPNTLRFHIQLIDYHWRLADLHEAMGIVVESPETAQTAKILVKVSGYLEGQCGNGRGGFLANYKYTIMIFVSIVVIFFITSYIYFHYLQPMVNLNAETNRRFTAENMKYQSSPLNRSGRYNTSMNSHICNKLNCSCGQEPVYGQSIRRFQ